MPPQVEFAQAVLSLRHGALVLDDLIRNDDCESAYVLNT